MDKIEDGYKNKLYIIPDWHDEWVKICKKRTNFNSKFSDEQNVHFEKLINVHFEKITPKTSSNKKFVQYSLAHRYIYELFKALEERPTPEVVLDLYKWKELHFIFFHFYYNEFLDKESKEEIDFFLNPSPHHKKYDLKILQQFLPNHYPIIANPEISLYDIDKEIILQMNTYEGGEKIAFLEHQYKKFRDVNTRSISLLAYLEELRERNLITNTSYTVSEKYINLQIQRNSKFENPIRTKLTQKQIGIFYRLLADSDFTNDNKSRIYNIIKLTHTSNEDKFPTFGYLERQTSKATIKDKVRLRYIIEELKKNLEKFPT